MMNNEKLHRETKMHADNLVQNEKNLIASLIVVQEREAYRDYHFKGLCPYIVKYLGLTKHVAQMMRTIANHALKLPELRAALENEKITVAYASRIVSRLTPGNVAEVLEYSSNHSVSQTETWLVKEKGSICYSMIPVDSETLELLRATKDFVSGNPSFNDLIKKVFADYGERNDPVVKAKRAAAKKQQAAFGANKLEPASTPQTKNQTKIKSASIETLGGRQPLTAAEKHAIHLRDESRCTFKEGDGPRCENTRWTHKHHIVPVAEGGTNNPANVATLCSEHHDLVHEVGIGFEIQRRWIATS